MFSYYHIYMTSVSSSSFGGSPTVKRSSKSGLVAWSPCGMNSRVASPSSKTSLISLLQEKSIFNTQSFMVRIPITLSSYPRASANSLLLADLVHRASLKKGFLTESTTPQISSPSLNCSPIQARIYKIRKTGVKKTSWWERVKYELSSLTAWSQSWLRDSPICLVLWNWILNLPPFSLIGSSHSGRMPCLKTKQLEPTSKRVTLITLLQAL